MNQHGRTIISGQSAVKTFDVDTTKSLEEWLAAQTSAHNIQLPWLLLHADSGVVWGEQHGSKLALSTNNALSWNSLHQARLFGEPGELFVWHGPQGWCARLIEDGKGEPAEWIEEQQLLWGNREDTTSTANTGFTPITEGSQGITHAPPIGNAIPNERSRASLVVRQYIGEDNAGVARVVYSRLVKLLKPE